MKYYNPNYTITINADGGSRALEKLGWKSELTVAAEKKSFYRSNKIRQWLRENWCDGHKSLIKSCGCPMREENAS